MLSSMLRNFTQVDVFASAPYFGNPVAVVFDADDLSTEQMQRVAHWMNLSETTFVVRVSSPNADYRLRIFTPSSELDFAGHPTLGTCHAWLAAGGTPHQPNVIVQECAAGLIAIRRSEGGLAFAAPPVVRSGPVDESLLQRLSSVLRIERRDVVDAQWVDNGPGWVAVMLKDAVAVLALEPDFGDAHHLKIGVIGPYPPGSPCAFEVRAFFRDDGPMFEDPVTGSLNASLAQWLLATGRATAPYVVSQGTRLGRAGRVHVDQNDDDSTIWVGGSTITCTTGTVEV
jgi:PhzF family phenazine biosynthesis protein